MHYGGFPFTGRVSLGNLSQINMVTKALNDLKELSRASFKIPFLFLNFCKDVLHRFQTNDIKLLTFQNGFYVFGGLGRLIN